jgi:hypothetical protein
LYPATVPPVSVAALQLRLTRLPLTAAALRFRGTVGAVVSLGAGGGGLFEPPPLPPPPPQAESRKPVRQTRKNVLTGSIGFVGVCWGSVGGLFASKADDLKIRHRVSAVQVSGSGIIRLIGFSSWGSDNPNRAGLRLQTPPVLPPASPAILFAPQCAAKYRPDRRTY